MAIKALVVLVGACVICAHGLAVGREGEDYVQECAEEVLANKQQVLPVPWDIEKDRDVGYVGDFEIKESALAEVKQGSLNTTREVESNLSPIVAIGSVRIRDTKQPATPPSNFRMGGVGGEEIRHLNGAVNPTADLTVWQWQRSRWAALKGWLEHWAGRGAGNKLVIVHSNGDVLYGGCTENELKQKYQMIIDAAANAGAATVKVVAAAEVSPFPGDMGWRYGNLAWTADRRSGMLQALSVADDWEKAYADCSNTTDGYCNSSPKYQFANGGFMVGPVNDLIDMLSPLATYTGSENRLVNEWFLRNQDKMTLDYAGIMSLSLHNMHQKGLPVEVVTKDGKKTLKNRVTGSTVCFVHGNGNSFQVLQNLAGELTA